MELRKTNKPILQFPIFALGPRKIATIQRRDIYKQKYRRLPVNIISSQVILNSIGQGGRKQLPCPTFPSQKYLKVQGIGN